MDKENEKTLFVPYYRVSTKQQGLSGLGLESQKIQCENFVNLQNGYILQDFTDILSGNLNSSKRINFNKAINFSIEKKGILLVYSLDRLGRNVMNFLDEILNNSELNFAIAQKNQVFLKANNNANEKMLLTLEMTLAEYERAKIKERTKNACIIRTQRKREKIEKGLKIHNVWEYANNAETKEKRKNIIIENAQTNPKNLQAYNFAKMLYENKKLSYTQIAKKLNEIGLKTIRNKKFGHQSIKNLFLLYQKKPIADNQFLNITKEKPQTQKEVLELIKELNAKQYSLNAISKVLNEKEVKTKNNKCFYAMQIKRILEKEI